MDWLKIILALLKLGSAVYDDISSGRREAAKRKEAYVLDRTTVLASFARCSERMRLQAVAESGQAGKIDDALDAERPKQVITDSRGTSVINGG